MWIFPSAVVALLIGLSFPLGRYLEWIIEGRYPAPSWLSRLERRLDTGPQNWKQYAFSLIWFDAFLFAAGFVLLSPTGRGC
jgi:K+-transporting ATPase ATPase A chain